jgi:hypothetical protein
MGAMHLKGAVSQYRKTTVGPLSVKSVLQSNDFGRVRHLEPSLNNSHFSLP